MLQTLQRVDESRTRQVLSRASEQLLPPSYVQGSPVELHPHEVAVVRDLLEEVERKVNATRPRDKEERRVRMLDVLSRQITEMVFAGTEQRQVRDRLGTQGRLPVSIYRLSFSPKFEKQSMFWGLSRGYIQKAITHCDQVQHLITKIEGAKGQPHASLFTQVPGGQNDPYTILVKCQRLADQLIIDEAYRIYHSELDLSDAASPLAVLERFVEKFGVYVEIEVIGTGMKPERRKFFHDLIYHLPGGHELVTKFTGGGETRVRRDDNFKDDDDRVEVSLCFGTDIAAYLAQLHRHGVKAEAPAEAVQSLTLRGVGVS